MKIKSLLLHKRLNIPGVSGSGVAAGNRINANGLDGSYVGACKTIKPFGTGFVIHVSGGPHNGFYEIPAYAVDHVVWDYTLADQHASGFITDDEWSQIQRYAQMQDPDLFEAKLSRARIDQIRKEFGPAPVITEAPQTPAKKNTRRSQTTPET